MTKKAFDIPIIHESIYADYKAGEITLFQAAVEFYRAGWTPYVDVDYTLKQFEKLETKNR